MVSSFPLQTIGSDHRIPIMTRRQEKIDLHIMMLAQVAKVAVEFLHTLLVRLGAFAFQALVKLKHHCQPNVPDP